MLANLQFFFYTNKFFIKKSPLKRRFLGQFSILERRNAHFIHSYQMPYFFSLAYSVGRLMSSDLATSERLPSYWFIAARIVRSSAASRVSKGSEPPPPTGTPPKTGGEYASSE